jgi:hypothetical protein
MSMAETSKPARPRKAKTAAKPGARKPAAKAAPRKSGAKPSPARTKATAKAKASAGKRKAAPRQAPRRAEASGFEGIAKLIDHPLVADLLAVGAMAAVAAIADHNVKTRTGEAEAGSSKVVKAAGKAAATAIGKRLMTEVDAVRGASKPRRD